MTHDQQFLVGSLMTLALLAVVVGGPLYILYRLMPRIQRARLDRQVEHHMRRGMANQGSIDRVRDKLTREYYEEG
ncbi:hypothetical protein OG806_08235 [Streptomyces sp. NBC_00882]|uniref:hypothetical protein n=1 Tax=Streptomyces sp. NBC_00882 TaxID=2975856 RepID=UPI00386EEA29|nr:hypothetical protein OG806_08235 [Streptomyces sp. NBC_00882]